MGVHGLWQLLRPTGQPVSLESLEGKILAVDVSIWLNQTVKGMRDRHGNPIPNAHLLGLYHRLCKLLYYRVKPVFVFDGGVPILKRQTLAQRRLRKDQATSDSTKTAQKLLDTMLKQRAVGVVLGSDSAHPAPTPLAAPAAPDMFELPPLPQPDQPSDDEPGSEAGQQEPWVERMSQRQAIYEEFQDPSAINLDSQDFQSLPPEVKHEILTDLKDAQKYEAQNHQDQLPADSDEFSKYQMAKLMKKNRLTQKIVGVRKEMSEVNSSDIASNFTGDLSNCVIESRRVMSEEGAHFILIKGLNKKKVLIDEASDSKTLVKNQDKASSAGNENSSVELAERNPMMEIKDVTENSERGGDGIRQTFSNSVDWGAPTVGPALSPKLGLFDLSSDDEEEKSDNNLSVSADKIHSNEHQDDQSTIQQHEQKDVPPKEVDSKNRLASVGEVKPDRIVDVPMSSTQLGETKRIDTVAADRGSVIAVESSSDEESFIEVVVDPSKIPDADELFPLSMFSHDPEKPLTSPAITPYVSATRPSTSPPNASLHLEEAASEPSQQSENITENTEPQDEVVAMEIIDDEEEEVAMDTKLADTESEIEKLTEADLGEMEKSLAAETRQLIQERGQQQRVGTSITDQMYAEAQELLQLFGVPYIISPMEAEAQCAHLDLTDQTHGTITDDSDIWLFGGRSVYKNLFNQKHHVELYRAKDIQNRLLLSRPQLVNVALLCGSDYTLGIPSVGPVTAMELLAEFRGEDISTLIRFKEWWDEAQAQTKAPQETDVKKKLRNVEIRPGFPSETVVDAYLQPTVDDSCEKFSWGKPDLDLLRQFTAEKFNWARAKTDETLLPVLKQLNQSQAQMHMTRYFPAEITEARTVKSQRVKRILTVMRHSAHEKTSGDKTGIRTSDLGSRVQDHTRTTASPKGKSTSKHQPKNMNVSRKLRQQTRQTPSNCSGGGFMSSVKAVPQEVVLSESSSESGVDSMFDSDDELLKNVDVDAMVRESERKVSSSSVGEVKTKTAEPAKRKQKSRTSKTTVPVKMTRTSRASGRLTQSVDSSGSDDS